MVKDRATKAPDGAAALAVVNGLRERHVLISATGPHSKNQKIRPPLVFTEARAGRLIDELDTVLRLLRE